MGGSCDYTLTLPTAPQPEPHLGPQTSVRLGLAFSAPGAGCEAREAPKGPACQGVRPKRAGHLRSPSRPGPARSRQSSSALEWGLAWDRQAVRDSGTSSATSQTWPTMALRFKSLSHVQLFVTPRTAARQAPLSMGFSGKVLEQVAMPSSRASS